MSDAPAHALPAVAVVAAQQSDPDLGLTAVEVDERRARYGPNTLAEADPVPGWQRLLAQFADPVVYLLLAAIGISGAVWIVEGADGFPFDVAVIAVIVVANAILGFVQERKAEEAVAALQSMTRSEALVVRDGSEHRIDAAELVPGDVILLAEGAVVPSDARLVEVRALNVAEAALTGESTPVEKGVEAVAASAGVADRICMVHRGTSVVSGRGRAVVTATGSATEVGRIATMLNATESEPTPLQREIDSIGKTLGVAVVFIAVGVVASMVIIDGLRTGEELLGALLIGVSLAVAAVPEGLPAVLSVVLALGVQRMSKQNALVKRLLSVEALGSSTVICTDKTGTLTRNEMMVRRVVVPSADVYVTGEGYEPTGQLVLSDGPLTDRASLDEIDFLSLAGVLASDATIVEVDGAVTALGDPTEAALVALRDKVADAEVRSQKRFERTGEIPFTSERRRMSTIDLDTVTGDTLMITKGAPDALFERCNDELCDGVPRPFDDAARDRWERAVDDLGDEALRTLAVAFRRLEPPRTSDGSWSDADEQQLTLLGVVGIMDPPRVEARDAIGVAHQAGIEIVMITGDHPRTASRIAVELGIQRTGVPAVSGAEIAQATDAELAELAASTNVYARVAPEDKLRIVQALTDRGEVVAMTGDGVNDAPALKAASIGVAMGVTGTDVSKEASDMILLDDNFATIVAAVGEGRAIFHNIRSFLRYLLGSNIGEVLTVFLGVLAASMIGLTGVDGPAAPLLAVQILWINLITDTGPALALGVDPPLPGLMDRRPRRLSERIVDRRMQVGIGLVGLTMAAVTLLMLDLRLPGGVFDGDRDLPYARTAAFTVLVLAQLFNTFSARSDTESAFVRPFANRWLVWAIVLSLGLQFAVVYVPVLNSAFGTVPLDAVDWVLSAVLASAVIWVAEVRKALLRRRTPVDELD